jgi:hypothetical protein
MKIIYSSFKFSNALKLSDMYMLYSSIMSWGKDLYITSFISYQQIKSTK